MGRCPERGLMIMPQATQELRDEWGIDDAKAIQYLERRGFTFKGGIIKATDPRAWDDEKARSAALFLIQEWDYDSE